jgi:phosphoribosyl-ATP pyrophosphohydrolase
MSQSSEFDDVLQRLARLIGTRRQDATGTSYTKELLDAGVERCARKLGEESIETIIAALGGDKQALKREAADLFYHLLVLAELQARMGTSGLAEKAARRGTSS